MKLSIYIDHMKADRVNTVVFNLHRIKRRNFFGTPGILSSLCELEVPKRSEAIC